MTYFIANPDPAAAYPRNGDIPYLEQHLPKRKAGDVLLDKTADQALFKQAHEKMTIDSLKTLSENIDSGSITHIKLMNANHKLWNSRENTMELLAAITGVAMWVFIVLGGAGVAALSTASAAVVFTGIVASFLFCATSVLMAWQFDIKAGKAADAKFQYLHFGIASLVRPQILPPETFVTPLDRKRLAFRPYPVFFESRFMAEMRAKKAEHTFLEWIAERRKWHDANKNRVALTH